MGFLGALSFLSRLPGRSGDPTALASSLRWFPLAGAGIGTLLGVVAGLWFELFPPGVAALSFVATYFAVKGLLHTDGLADCADALAAPVPPEARQRILHDPHVGVGGVLAVTVFVLGLWTSAWTFPRPGPVVRFAPAAPLAPSLSSVPFPWGFALAVVLAEVAADTAMVLLLAAGPLAEESRLARLFRPGVTRPALALAFGSALAVLAVGGSVLAPLALGTLLLTGLVGARVVRGALGGVGGDALGAAHDVVFLLLLLAAAIVPWSPWI